MSFKRNKAWINEDDLFHGFLTADQSPSSRNWIEVGNWQSPVSKIGRPTESGDEELTNLVIVLDGVEVTKKAIDAPLDNLEPLPENRINGVRVN